MTPIERMQTIVKEGRKLCKAKLICESEDGIHRVESMFIEVCKNNDFWPYSERNPKYTKMIKMLDMPHTRQLQIDKFKKEAVENEERVYLLYTNYFKLFSPLCAFKEPAQISVSKFKRMSLKRFIGDHSVLAAKNPKVRFHDNEDLVHIQDDDGIKKITSRLSQQRASSQARLRSLLSGVKDENIPRVEEVKKRMRRNTTFNAFTALDEIPVHYEKAKDQGSLVPCCLSCFRLLEMFSIRYYSLVFLPDEKLKTLKELKNKGTEAWTADNLKFLINVYKNSKNDQKI